MSALQGLKPQERRDFWDQARQFYVYGEEAPDGRRRWPAFEEVAAVYDVPTKAVKNMAAKQDWGSRKAYFRRRLGLVLAATDPSLARGQSRRDHLASQISDGLLEYIDDRIEDARAAERKARRLLRDQERRLAAGPDGESASKKEDRAALLAAARARSLDPKELPVLAAAAREAHRLGQAASGTQAPKGPLVVNNNLAVGAVPAPPVPSLDDLEALSTEELERLALEHRPSVPETLHNMSPGDTIYDVTPESPGE